MWTEKARCESTINVQVSLLYLDFFWIRLLKFFNLKSSLQMYPDRKQRLQLVWIQQSVNIVLVASYVLILYPNIFYNFSAANFTNNASRK